MPTILYANTIDYNMPLQQRPHHIFNLLAKRGWKVHWVNQTQKADKAPDRYENLTVWHNWSQFKKRVPEVDVYFSSWSDSHLFTKQIPSKVIAYDSLDLFPQNEKNEKEMVKIADIIFTTTQNIFNYHRGYSDKPIFMCENGCFTDKRDNEFELPKEFLTLPKPWVLFSGALAIEPKGGWVDYETVKKISENYSTFVVGGIWGWSNAGQNEQAQKKFLPKVNFVGYKKYEQLQAYYKYADVNIVPFKRCQTADYSSPLKLIEGCNLGTPSVSSDIPVAVEFAREFPDAVYLATSPEDFIKKISLARVSKNSEDCFKLADLHSWEKKVDTIEKELLNILKDRG